MIERDGPTATPPHGCGRGEELVAYLYGEATKEEAGLFRLHLEACAVCREELNAFGIAREGLSLWRAEALDALPALNIEAALAPSTKARPSAARRRSARAALSEFFSLSPLWLRAGAFAATVAVCALFALTLARTEFRWGADGLAFRAGVTEKVVKEEVRVPAPVGFTEEQVNAIVERRVEEAKARLVAESKQNSDEPRAEQIVNVNAVKRGSQQSSNPNTTRRQRATRRTESQDDSLLADDNLPRLSDLLSGSF